MEEDLSLPTGIQTFKDVIELGGIYVDKTAYLAKMIETVPKTWFLARPRRFGKSLTVSTFKSIFSGQRELFKGLAIEKMLVQKKFAPRPVIHLDLSTLTTSQGKKRFYKSLIDTTKMLYESLNIDVPDYDSVSALFSYLITKCSKTYDSQVVVLIDEYDTPITKLLDKPDEAENARKALREFYSQLKANDEYISFVFVTGITKYIKGGLYSAFNNPTDISLRPQFGALTGFTHDEIKRYYGQAIKQVAKSQKVTNEELLGEMKRYYNGFCFDAETLVYNPFSTLRFFEEKKF
ncbi:MAG: AAA family ATPase, partial [Deltaproteobacteria bacterium]|nr:AAA family ATPase [Deltaproteobacteria bacterium]